MSDDIGAGSHDSDISRRDALKKAAVGVGVAAWSAPTIQALSEVPAFASATTPGACPPDLTMQSGSPQPTGLGWRNANAASRNWGTTLNTVGHVWTCGEHGNCNNPPSGSGTGCSNSACRCITAPPNSYPQRWPFWFRVLQWQKEVSFGSATPANNRCRFICEVVLDPVGRKNDGWYYAVPGNGCNTSAYTPSAFSYRVRTPSSNGTLALRFPLPSGAASFVAPVAGDVTWTDPLSSQMIPTSPTPTIQTFGGASYLEVALTNFALNTTGFTTGPGWSGGAWTPTLGQTTQVDPIVITVAFTVNMASCVAPRVYAPGMSLNLCAGGTSAGLGCHANATYWIPGSDCTNATYCTGAVNWGSTVAVCGCA